jgi:hypothetical protein
MNTRGIVQLVVLNIGVELGVLSPVIFSIFVLMATILTLFTSPILSLLYGRNYDIQKLSVPNVAEQLRNVRGGEINIDVINNINDNIETISNGDINNRESKINSGKTSREPSINMPTHDTLVTFDDRINYLEISPNTDGQGTEEIDRIADGSYRSINMKRF